MADDRPARGRRHSDHSGTLMSHAPPGLALPVPLLTVPVTLSAPLGLLVASAGLTALRPAGGLPAGRATVALPTVAAYTDGE
ncbi:MAG TPA: hypothetical protein VKU19_07530 [Bryobacteraceae bacterium]|nr:hypothetical protein [Bryobacteraceae bacterium]